jgi:hypothetical protein
MAQTDGNTRQTAFGTGLLPFHLSQQPENDRPRGPVLLQINQQLAEAPSFGMAPELADPHGAVEVGETKDVQKLSAPR